MLYHRNIFLCLNDKVLYVNCWPSLCNLICKNFLLNKHFIFYNVSIMYTLYYYYTSTTPKRLWKKYQCKKKARKQLGSSCWEPVIILTSETQVKMRLTVKLHWWRLWKHRCNRTTMYYNLVLKNRIVFKTKWYF